LPKIKKNIKTIDFILIPRSAPKLRNVSGKTAKPIESREPEVYRKVLLWEENPSAASRHLP
jgi:hypothetical protein